MNGSQWRPRDRQDDNAKAFRINDINKRSEERHRLYSTVRKRRNSERGCEVRTERTRADKGVNSEGFMTMVQPQARAGATFQALSNK